MVDAVGVIVRSPIFRWIYKMGLLIFFRRDAGGEWETLWMALWKCILNGEGVVENIEKDVN